MIVRTLCSMHTMSHITTEDGMRFSLWLLALALSACAAGQVQLPPGVTTSGQFLERIEASYRGLGSVAEAQKCAALELTNPDVLVSGTAGGVLRSGLPTAQVLPGSGVVQQVGDDFLVARAAAEYSVLGGITSRVVRFSLLIEFTNGQVKATAGDIT